MNEKKIGICWGLFIVLLSRIFFEPEIQLILSFFICIYDIVITRKISYKLNCKSWIFLVICFFGVTMSFYGNYKMDTHAIFRFCYYVLSPIFYIYIGYISFKKYTIDSIIKTIFYAEIINVLQIISNIFIKIMTGGLSYTNLRSVKQFVTDLIIYVIFIYLLKDNQKVIFSKRLDRLIFISSIAILIFTFSRTHLLYLICGLIIYALYSFSLRKLFINFIITTIVLFFTSIVVVNNETLLNFSTEYIEKIATSLNEVSNKDTWNYKEVNNSWRGYEIHLEIEQFSNADYIQKLLGTGGKGVYAGKYANLVSKEASEGFLPVIHNGYFGVLAYSGIIGLILYIFFYIDKLKIGIKCYSKTNSLGALLLIIITIGSAVSSYIVMGLISPGGATLTCIMFGILSNHCYNEIKQM